MLIRMAQLSEPHVCGSSALAVMEEQARMNQPHAIRWVVRSMYSASFTSLHRSQLEQMYLHKMYIRLIVRHIVQVKQ